LLLPQPLKHYQQLIPHRYSHHIIAIMLWNKIAAQGPQRSV